ncbi:hypothetical protein [Mucilaginibacter sp.]|uniref:hypothetical protein n=1 Tax=Mucilaginibacter sp. TaxID=1882438 RepID=UPI0025EDAF98|nr:hypothetical protein [Mucilaginibacter sp.]
MKQNFFAVLFFSAILLLGCSKSSSTKPVNSNKVYLLKSSTSVTANGLLTVTNQYSYDEKNRVTELKVSVGNRYKYTYDDNNNLATVVTYNENDILQTSDKYVYTGNVITVNSSTPDPGITNTYSFTLSSQKQVVSSSLEGSQQFTYDAIGNLAGYAQCCVLKQSDTYQYDDKKHPLSMIGARNFSLMFLMGTPVSFINNVTKDVGLGAITTYVYNSDGFPTSSIVTNSDRTGNPSTTFQYLIK